MLRIHTAVAALYCQYARCCRCLRAQHAQRIRANHASASAGATTARGEAYAAAYNMRHATPGGAALRAAPPPSSLLLLLACRARYANASRARQRATRYARWRARHMRHKIAALRKLFFAASLRAVVAAQPASASRSARHVTRYIASAPPCAMTHATPCRAPPEAPRAYALARARRR